MGRKKKSDLEKKIEIKEINETMIVPPTSDSMVKETSKGRGRGRGKGKTPSPSTFPLESASTSPTSDSMVKETGKGRGRGRGKGKTPSPNPTSTSTPTSTPIPTPNTIPTPNPTSNPTPIPTPSTSPLKNKSHEERIEESKKLLDDAIAEEKKEKKEKIQGKSDIDAIMAILKASIEKTKSKTYIHKSTKKNLNNHKAKIIGTVLSVKDAVAFIDGLPNIKVGELVEFINKDLYGMALNLENTRVGVIIFGDDTKIKQGDLATTKGKLVSVSVGDEILGRVVDALGEPIDGKMKIESKKIFNIERKAPGVITRKSVTRPLLTGYKIVDSMLPIGRGQRELILGDRQTGKTTIAIDTILNQAYLNEENIDVSCIYVGIGQKKSSILNLQTLLESKKSMFYTTIVAATASQSASLQFIAPYTGCSIAEYFRDNGRDALIIYDDLSKHAAAYRQLSLLLRRPPGREAFPGDIFYAHARLLERACNLNENYGSGSLTALPIVETQAGDVSGYIPTNVISITDGQIFMEKDLFFKGIRPAVNVGNSVSRVGSKAQPYALKIITGNLRYELAQFREYSVFAQFDSDIDDITRGILNRGNLLTEVLKQAPNSPLELHKECIILLASAFGFISPFVKDFKKDSSNILKYESSLFDFMSSSTSWANFYQPIFKLYHLADKNDFKFESNPILPILNRFKANFGIEILKKKKTLA